MINLQITFIQPTFTRPPLTFMVVHDITPVYYKRKNKIQDNNVVLLNLRIWEKKGIISKELNND